MSTSTTPVTIHVTLSTIVGGASRYGRYEQRYYECFGPDGTKFTNSSKATLKSVLQRRYGKVVLVIEDVR
jgi:hypothetical protein